MKCTEDYNLYFKVIVFLYLEQTELTLAQCRPDNRATLLFYSFYERQAW